MKIGVITGSSVCDKNQIIVDILKEIIPEYEVIDFGCYLDENIYSYVDISLLISLLISSKSVDFIVTGCSSGQGMMLACNSLPNIICGYTPTPTDAYLFGRINNGNVISLPLNYGWAGEINLKYIISALFEEKLGIGYPQEDSSRKIKDTNRIKKINKLSKKSFINVVDSLSQNEITHMLDKRNVIDYVLKCGKDEDIKEWLRNR